MKRVLSVFIIFTVVLSMTACSGTGGETTGAKEISIAYQPSIGYAPLLVMKEQGLIEKAYSGEITVNWKEMKNGAEINEGLVSGALDIGSMGVPVAITGVLAGSPYKIASGLSAQPYSILTNQPAIKTLKDIRPEDQIAVVNINSQPHILLAMACRQLLGDARALDKNLVKLGNADGYSSIISGAVNCHMVISPFNFMELRSTDADIHEIPIDSSIWPEANTALVTVVRNSLHDDPELYNAFITAMDTAMEYISEYPAETAELLSAGYDASADEILEWMSDPRSSYSTELRGVMDMANFMVEEGFLENGPASIKDIAYDEVKGE